MNMPPIIGVSGKIATGPRWYKRLAETDFEAVEIIRRKNALPFHPDNLQKVMDHLGDRDLSIHSGTMRIFSDDPMLSETELSILKGEVYMANYLGIKEVIFHLRDRALSEEEKSKLSDVISFSN